MLIGVRKRFVFVANSKTASTSIESLLVKHAEIARAGTPARKHIRLRDVFAEYDFLFGRPEHAPARFFIFGVMRDPVDWLQSWFRYRKRPKAAHPLPADMSFCDFWDAGDWTIRHPDGRPHLQSDYFTDSAGQVVADYIIPYETLATHLERICAGLGVHGTLPTLNVTPQRDLDSTVSARVDREMQAHYAADYALFSRLEEINQEGQRRLRQTRP